MAFALPEFRGGLPAAEVDRSLKSALAAHDAARQCALVWFHEVMSRFLYRDLGYASMEQYAVQALGFSRNRYWQFMKMARDLERLEPLRQAVVDGQLEWSKAQQVGRVATPETAELWVKTAQESSRRELAQGIKKARETARQVVRGDPGQAVLPLATGAAADPTPTPVPPALVSMSLSFEALDAARLEAMIEAGKKAGLIPATARREEAILLAVAALLEAQEDPVRRRTGLRETVQKDASDGQECQELPA